VPLGPDGQRLLPPAGEPNNDAPVAFFQPVGQPVGQPQPSGGPAQQGNSQPPQLGPDGLPLRKRRRRRRRGRGGRQREWRMGANGPGPTGTPNTEAGGDPGGGGEGGGGGDGGGDFDDGGGDD
jgi:hypothetical protein